MAIHKIGTRPASSTESKSAQQKEIDHWLETVRFKRSLVGGLNEQDVWKKLGELNALNETAILAERIRYDTLSQEYKEYKDKTNKLLVACKEALVESRRRYYQAVNPSYDANDLTGSEP